MGGSGHSDPSRKRTGLLKNAPAIHVRGDVRSLADLLADEPRPLHYRR